MARIISLPALALALMPALVSLHGCGVDYEFFSGDEAREDGRLAPHSGEHVVRKGDTLYAIAWLHTLDYRELADWNDVKAPRYLIYPGQRLRLRPPADYRRVAPEDERPAKPSESAPRAAPAPRTTRAGKTSAAKAPAGKAPAWKWPLRSPHLKARARRAGGGHGLLMRGAAGQTVHSAAAGRVVYSGFGLKHYQGLVIVRHAGDFFSAYGGNDRLLVREGDQVAAGAPLGLLARESIYTRGAALYFEIRRRGRAVNALRYLPAS